MFKKINNLLLILVLIVSLTTGGVFYYLSIHVISILRQEIEVHIKYMEQQLVEFMVEITNVISTLIENDKIQNKYNQIFLDNLDKIQKNQSKLEQQIGQVQTININNLNNLKQANLDLVNITAGVGGSGSHIKINNKSYILTCRHLLDEVTDKVIGYLDNGEEYNLELIKNDTNTDLALFKISDINKIPYMIISNELPDSGSAIIAIGNPINLRDAITDGVIITEDKEGYIFSNKIFLGNSGGAILYKGKLVGVITQMRTIIAFPTIITYGYAVKLKIIKEFLSTIK